MLTYDSNSGYNSTSTFIYTPDDGISIASGSSAPDLHAEQLSPTEGQRLLPLVDASMMFLNSTSSSFSQIPASSPLQSRRLQITEKRQNEGLFVFPLIKPLSDPNGLELDTTFSKYCHDLKNYLLPFLMRIPPGTPASTPGLPSPKIYGLSPDSSSSPSPRLEDSSSLLFILPPRAPSSAQGMRSPSPAQQVAFSRLDDSSSSLYALPPRAPSPAQGLRTGSPALSPTLQFSSPILKAESPSIRDSSPKRSRLEVLALPPEQVFSVAADLINIIVTDDIQPEIVALIMKKLAVLTGEAQSLFDHLKSLEKKETSIKQEEINFHKMKHDQKFKEIFTRFKEILNTIQISRGLNPTVTDLELKTQKKLDDIRDGFEIALKMTNENYKLQGKHTLKSIIERRITSMGWSVEQASSSASDSNSSTTSNENLKRITCNIDDSLDKEFKTDAISFSNLLLDIDRILMNIFNNSEKYGGPEMSFSHIPIVNGVLTIVFSDNGPGFFQDCRGFNSLEEVNAKAREKLLSFRSQADGGNEGTGSGIGGASLGALIEELSGELNIETRFINSLGVNEGHDGTKITITIPHLKEVIKKTVDEESILTQEQSLKTLANLKIHVIAIDDEPINTKVCIGAIKQAQKKWTTPAASITAEPIQKLPRFTISAYDDLNTTRSNLLNAMVKEIEEKHENLDVITLLIDENMDSFPSDHQYPDNFKGEMVVQHIKQSFSPESTIFKKLQFINYTSMPGGFDSIYQGKVTKPFKIDTFLQAVSSPRLESEPSVTSAASSHPEPKTD